MEKKEQFLHFLCLIWGVGGVIALIARALFRLTPTALEPIQTLTVAQWAILLSWCGFMAYSEGYKGFHLAFAPRVIARANYLGNHPTILRIVFAPLICMGLFYATKKRLIVSWCLLIGIISLIVAIRLLEQPWRGIVDAGVVLGLGLGLMSLLYFLIRAIAGQMPSVNPDIPSPA